ncbi:MAG: glycosyltransferase family 2 protein [Candidatus Levybacteria bacterium]|nr:glycosyltransferase family 2 protein [Candidatus Levybacteria bacterium]
MNPEYSVVIPVLNEDESLSELIARIKEAFEVLDKKYEIIFIDDGSSDNTFSLLQKYARDNSHIHVISFRRNMGKSTALSLGFQKAKGDFIITMDADLQDDPANIARLIEGQKSGDFDLVSGWRKNRKDSILKVINSKFFNNFVIPLLFGSHFNDMNSGLKLYKKDLAKDIKIYGGMHRFIPILASEMGFKVKEVPTQHNPRKYGHSKYKSTKIFTDIPDLITMYFLVKYTRRPLHFFSKLGGSLLLVGSLILLYLIILKLFGEAIGDRPLLIFGVLFVIAGLQTIFTGLLADLMVNFSRSDTQKDLPIRFES